MSVAPERLTDPALRFELCQDGDVPALMRFVGTEWHAGHILSRDEPLLRWQFAPALMKHHPAPGPTVLLAWHDHEIVGMLGLTGFDLNVAGTPFPAMWLSHWFATPSYRRHNVALRLMWAARDLGVEALATLGANEVSAKLLARLGLELIPSLPRWVGVFDVAAAAELFCLANREISPEDARQLCQSHQVERRAVDRRNDGFQPASWSETAAAAWDRFWCDVLARQLVGASRDTSYLHWRYVAHPRFVYHVRFARRDSDGSVEGIAVYRVEQVRDQAMRVLRVVEFLGSAAAEATLFQSVLDAARDSRVALADFYCSSARTAEPLARAGFKRQPPDSQRAAFPTRFQPLESGYVPVTTLVRLPQEWRGALPQFVADGRLYITKSDGDQDRPN